LTEKFTERTAGIWVPLVFYAAGGIYMLAFWAVFTQAAYHLILLGIASIAIAFTLYKTSRWAYWLGLVTFPLMFVEFLYGLVASVNLAGWDPNVEVAAFNGSMIVYLVILTLSLILLIDRRNALKSDRILDMLKSTAPPAPAKSAKKSSSDKGGR
jgi:hypothetical protein